MAIRITERDRTAILSSLGAGVVPRVGLPGKTTVNPGGSFMKYPPLNEVGGLRAQSEAPHVFEEVPVVAEVQARHLTERQVGGTLAIQIPDETANTARPLGQVGGDGSISVHGTSTFFRQPNHLHPCGSFRQWNAHIRTPTE